MVVEQSQAEALAAAAAAGDSLICQAIINSGIALGTEEAVVEETSQVTEEIHKVDSDSPDADEGVTEIHVKEEFVEVEMEAEVRRKLLICCTVFEDMSCTSNFLYFILIVIFYISLSFFGFNSTSK